MFKIKSINPDDAPTPEAGKSIIIVYNDEMYIKGSNGVSRKISVPIPEPTTRHLTLTVNDQDTAPLEGAEIFVNDVSVGLTSVLGVIEIDVPRAQFTLRIEKKGYDTIDTIKIAGTEDFSDTQRIDIFPRQLTLTVTNNMGAPIAGASVKIELMKIGTTGPSGILQTHVPNSETTLTISAIGYITEDFLLEAGIIDVEGAVSLETYPA